MSSRVDSVERSLIQFKLQGDIEAIWLCLASPKRKQNQNVQTQNTKHPQSITSPTKNILNTYTKSSLKRKKSADILTSRRKTIYAYPQKEKETDPLVSHEMRLKFLKENMLASNLVRSSAHQVLLQGFHSTFQKVSF
mgnify:CR=1 FL=1